MLELNISWNFSGTSKLLGMGFDLSQNDKTVKHITDKNIRKRKSRYDVSTTHIHERLLSWLSTGTK